MIWEGIIAAEPNTDIYQAYREEMGRDIRNQQAIQQSGLPEEQAAATAFLACDNTSFITGQMLNCSGGQS